MVECDFSTKKKKKDKQQKIVHFCILKNDELQKKEKRKNLVLRKYQLYSWDDENQLSKKKKPNYSRMLELLKEMRKLQISSTNVRHVLCVLLL